MTQQLLNAHYQMLREVSIELGIGMIVAVLSYIILRKIFL